VKLFTEIIQNSNYYTRFNLYKILGNKGEGKVRWTGAGRQQSERRREAAEIKTGRQNEG
jgi:hypothetical protein